MTRFWIGIGLLIVLLLCGILTAVLMPKFHLPVADALENAAAYSLSGDYENAEIAFKTAENRWEKYHDFTAAFCDHDKQDEMDAMFSRIAFEASNGKWEEFGADCASLSVMARDLSTLHGISLPQLL